MGLSIIEASTDPGPVRIVGTSPYADLRPIRIGAMAYQPAPDQSALFVGQADLLPSGLRALCSCAGLFFGQIIDEHEEEIQLHVAALPRYFDSGPRTYGQHVREITISYSQLDQMLTYEHRFASMQTDDLQALVATQAEQSRRRTARVCGLSLLPLLSSELTDDQIPHAENKEVPSPATEREEADLEPLVKVFVSRSIVRDTFERLHITALRERRVHTAMLVATLDAIEMELERCRFWRERQALEKQAEEIKRVQSWRRQRRDSGYGWQRVVVAEAAVENGVAGWDMTVGRPVEQAA